jgi:hypothetical protein
MANPSLPAYLQNDAADDLARRISDNLPKSAPPYISIEGNRFTLVDSAGEEEAIETLYLDVCILDVGDHISKIYYEQEYGGKAGTGAPPDCWSDNGVAPSRSAAKPQSPTCMGCPKNEWGSAVSKMSGKGVKACRDYYKLACLVPGDDMIFLLRVPPNSLKNIDAYTMKFNGQEVGLSSVMTRMSFVPGVQGTLQFQAIDYIDEATHKTRIAVRNSKATDAIVGRTDKPREGLPISQPVAQITAPAAPPQAFVPNVGSPSTPTQTAPLAPAASPSEPTKRKRRTKAEMVAAGQPTQGTVQAPFRPEPPPSTPGNSGAPFGMAPGVAPNPELQATLDGLGIFKQ